MKRSSHPFRIPGDCPFLSFDGEIEMMDHYPAEGNKTVVAQ